MKATKKTFDCVEMMHRGAALIRKELEGRSLEEEMEYWRRGTKALRTRQQLLKRERAAREHHA